MKLGPKPKALAKALYVALSEDIVEEDKQAELDAAFDILDPLIDSLEGERDA